MFYYIIAASFVGSVFALIGGVLLIFKEDWAKSVSLFLLSFASGSLIGAAFFELLPEALETVSVRPVFVAAAGGILMGFIFEKFLKWYHCHDQQVCDYHTFSGTVLFGDAIHNFLDGVVIAFSFSLGLAPGFAAAVAVFFHEVPQEIGDFGVLLHAGYQKGKVFLYNFLTALTTPLGAVAGYFLSNFISDFLPYLLAFAAGSFIYIAASDLLPEVRHKTAGNDLGHLSAIVAGLAVIYALGIIFPE